jgi:hypothetical protein
MTISEALNIYGDHNEWCGEQVDGRPSENCTCGFNAALATAMKFDGAFAELLNALQRLDRARRGLEAWHEDTLPEAWENVLAAMRKAQEATL